MKLSFSINNNTTPLKSSNIFDEVILIIKTYIYEHKQHNNIIILEYAGKSEFADANKMKIIII